MKIKKKDLVDLVYQDLKGVNKVIVSKVIDLFLKELNNILNENEEVDVELRGFGVFKKRKRKSAVIQNPKTKEKKIYSDLYSIRFKMSKTGRK